MTIFAALVSMALAVLLVEAAALLFRASYQREESRFAEWAPAPEAVEPLVSPNSQAA